jgi:hypothetical protein
MGFITGIMEITCIYIYYIIYIYIRFCIIVIVFYHGNDTVIEWPGINGDIWKVNEHDRIWRKLWLMRNRHLQ